MGASCLKNPKLLGSFQQRPFIETVREGVSLVVANFLVSEFFDVKCWRQEEKGTTVDEMTGWHR